MYLGGWLSWGIPITESTPREHHHIDVAVCSRSGPLTVSRPGLAVWLGKFVLCHIDEISLCHEDSALARSRALSRRTRAQQQTWRALHWSGFSALVLYACLLHCQGVTGPGLML